MEWSGGEVDGRWMRCGEQGRCGGERREVEREGSKGKKKEGRERTGEES